jgi:hypothetical protein
MPVPGRQRLKKTTQLAQHQDHLHLMERELGRQSLELMEMTAQVRRA